MCVWVEIKVAKLPLSVKNFYTNKYVGRGLHILIANLTRLRYLSLTCTNSKIRLFWQKIKFDPSSESGLRSNFYGFAIKSGSHF